MDVLLIKYYAYFGRMGSLDGAFLCNERVWEQLRKYCRYYDSDVLGKHSEIYGSYGDEKDFTVVKTLNKDQISLLKGAFQLIESPLDLGVLEKDFDYKNADYDAPTVTLYGYNPCERCSYQDGSDDEE